MKVNFQAWVCILLYCIAARPIVSQYSGAFLVKEAQREKYINNVVNQELKHENELKSHKSYAPVQTELQIAPTYDQIYHSNSNNNNNIRYNANVSKRERNDKINYLNNKSKELSKDLSEYFSRKSIPMAELSKKTYKNNHQMQNQPKQSSYQTQQQIRYQPEASIQLSNAGLNQQNSAYDQIPPHNHQDYQNNNQHNNYQAPNQHNNYQTQNQHSNYQDYQTQNQHSNNFDYPRPQYDQIPPQNNYQTYQNQQNLDYPRSAYDQNPQKNYQGYQNSDYDRNYQMDQNILGFQNNNDYQPISNLQPVTQSYHPGVQQSVAQPERTNKKRKRKPPAFKFEKQSEEETTTKRPKLSKKDHPLRKSRLGMIRNQNDPDKPLMLQKYLAKLLESETYDESDSVEDENHETSEIDYDDDDSEYQNSKSIRVTNNEAYKENSVQDKKYNRKLNKKTTYDSLSDTDLYETSVHPYQKRMNNALRKSRISLIKTNGGDQPPLLKEYLSGKLKKEKFKLMELGIDDTEVPSLRDNYRKINRGDRVPKTKRPDYKTSSEKKRRRRKKLKETESDSGIETERSKRRRKIKKNRYDEEATNDEEAIGEDLEQESSNLKKRRKDKDERKKGDFIFFPSRRSKNINKSITEREKDHSNEIDYDISDDEEYDEEIVNEIATRINNRKRMRPKSKNSSDETQSKNSEFLVSKSQDDQDTAETNDSQETEEHAKDQSVNESLETQIDRLEHIGSLEGDIKKLKKDKYKLFNETFKEDEKESDIEAPIPEEHDEEKFQQNIEDQSQEDSKSSEIDQDRIRNNDNEDENKAFYRDTGLKRYHHFRKLDLEDEILSDEPQRNENTKSRNFKDIHQQHQLKDAIKGRNFEGIKEIFSKNSHEDKEQEIEEDNVTSLNEKKQGQFKKYADNLKHLEHDMVDSDNDVINTDHFDRRENRENFRGRENDFKNSKIHLDRNENMDHPGRREDVGRFERNEDIDHFDRNENMDHPGRREDVGRFGRNEDIDHFDRNENMDHPGRRENQHHSNKRENMGHPDRRENQHHSNKRENMDHSDRRENYHHFNKREKIDQFEKEDEADKKHHEEKIHLMKMTKKPLEQNINDESNKDQDRDDSDSTVDEYEDGFILFDKDEIIKEQASLEEYEEQRKLHELDYVKKVEPSEIANSGGHIIDRAYDKNKIIIMNHLDTPLFDKEKLIEEQSSKEY